MKVFAFDTQFEPQILHLKEDFKALPPERQRVSHLATFLNIHSYLFIIPFKVKLDNNGKYIFVSTRLRKVKKLL